MAYFRVKKILEERLADWGRTQGVETLPGFSLELPPGNIPADFALNAAMQLSKPLRKSPREIAGALKELLSRESDLFESVEIAGPGFLNLRLKTAVFQDELERLLREGPRFGGGALGGKLLIEFVSANPTGPLHVGHGRGAALGDSLARIYAHLGTAVSREFYINDAGNQIELLGVSLQRRVEELQKNVPFQVPEGGYGGDYLKETAREMVKAVSPLPSDPHAYTLFAKDRMLASQKEDLEKFRVSFESWFSEKKLFEDGAVDSAVAALRKNGYLQEKDGALWFVRKEDEEKGLEDKERVLRRSDGRWTYFASDIAYHKQKLDRGFDRLIDIWGADHHGYVPRVKNAIQALGADADRLHILLYQLVTLYRGAEKVSMSKRTGDFISLREVMEEVGTDACRFFFAMRSPNSALDFDLDLAKKQSVDNPVYYVQYSHARIRSIFRQEAAAELLKKEKAPSFGKLAEPEERDLMKALSLFPRILSICAQEESPHFLTNYLIELSACQHRFYDRCRVLGADPALGRARLALLEGTAIVLAKGLELLGVSAPEKM